LQLYREFAICIFSTQDFFIAHLCLFPYFLEYSLLEFFNAPKNKSFNLDLLLLPFFGLTRIVKPKIKFEIIFFEII